MTKEPDENTLRYDRMVEKALRSVARQAIEEVIEDGLPGDHHFYITFLTDYEGVQIPDYLRERYPGEMTIVLQYQFYDLSVDDKFLKVTLKKQKNIIEKTLKIILMNYFLMKEQKEQFTGLKTLLQKTLSFN